MFLHALALLPGLWLAPGQEPQKKEEHPVVVPLPQDPEVAHQQMVKLIGQVELRLRQIDKLLGDASAAQRPAADPSTRTAELFRRSQDEVQQVVESIDRILELADHAHRGRPGHGA